MERNASCGLPRAGDTGQRLMLLPRASPQPGPESANPIKTEIFAPSGVPQQQECPRSAAVH